MGACPQRELWAHGPLHFSLVPGSPRKQFCSSIHSYGHLLPYDRPKVIRPPWTRISQKPWARMFAFSLQICLHKPFEYTVGIFCSVFLLHSWHSFSVAYLTNSILSCAQIHSSHSNENTWRRGLMKKFKVLMKPNISISFSFAVCALDTISKNHQAQYPMHLFLFKKHTEGPSCHSLTPSLPLHMVS